MVEPFLSEIRMFANDFAPEYWAFCDGQSLPINENSALFSLVGTTYGGDGRVTLGLPDFQGRTPIGFGTGPGLSPQILGDFGGMNSVKLTTDEIATHTHTAKTSFTLDKTKVVDTATGNYISRSTQGTSLRPFHNAPNINAQTLMSKNCLKTSGGSAAHENRQPFLAINFSIALEGTYPQRN